MAPAVRPQFWRGKKVFVTGHTGFKGSWLSLWLQEMGADVTGYALAPYTDPSLFELAGVAKGMASVIGDINDAAALQDATARARPEIVLHLAAQSLVRLSYDQPKETFATNVMGTVNVLEAVRAQRSVRAAVIVTSDKCYENRETLWSYREPDAMGGHDPYSASKGCAELVCAAYRNSFLKEAGVALASARAGNVIGGGDWSRDRLIPDILSAMEKRAPLAVRNPLSTRPWQHVLESLSGYLLLAENLWDHGQKFASGWNFGPDMRDVRTVEWICNALQRHCGKTLDIHLVPDPNRHEAGMLALDYTKAYRELGWQPQWPLEEALVKIAQWAKAYWQKQNMRTVCLQQIADYASPETA